MSQKKVDKYKESKANRRKEIKKQKRKRLIATISTYVVLALVVAFIGWSVWKEVNPSSKEETTTKKPSLVSEEELASMLGVTTPAAEGTTPAVEGTTPESSSKEEETSEKSDSKAKDDKSEPSAGE